MWQRQREWNNSHVKNLQITTVKMERYTLPVKERSMMYLVVLFGKMAFIRDTMQGRIWLTKSADHHMEQKYLKTILLSGLWNISNNTENSYCLGLWCKICILALWYYNFYFYFLNFITKPYGFYAVKLGSGMRSLFGFKTFNVRIVFVQKQ